MHMDGFARANKRTKPRRV